MKKGHGKVDLDTCEPDSLWELLEEYPAISARYVARVAGGWPCFEFRGPVTDLEAMIRKHWDDGSGDHVNLEYIKTGR